MDKDIRVIIIRLISQAVESLGIEINPKDIILEHPADMLFGDYSTNIALKLAQKHNRSPKDLAASVVVEILRTNDRYLSKVEVAGPGFINFYLAREFFLDQISNILELTDDFGRGVKKDKKILVEYSSPNIAKPLMVGHLRSTIIGDAVSNILSFSGYEVIRDNHLGDWGTQFGKQIVAIKKWGDESLLDKSSEPLKDLVSLYVKFHEEAEKDPILEDQARDWTKKLEENNQEAVALWQKIISWSLAEIKKVYEILDIKFDTYLGESFYLEKTKEVIALLEKTNFYKKSDDAYLVFFPEDKYPPLMIRKKDGSTIYATRDLAADLYRLKTYGPNLAIVNEVGVEQSLYFQQLFEIEKELGWFGYSDRIHVAHGLYRFKDGKMSTRKGKVIWVEDIIDEAIIKAEEFNPAVAREVGIGALKYNDLKRESRGDIIFDWAEILNLKGNSGPYLQYTYARIQSILARAEQEGIKPVVTEVDEITNVEKLLYRFPEVVERACQDYAPHHIATYLYELASAFSAYYVDHQVVSPESNSPYRVALAKAAGQVIKNGLTLLGIKSPAKM